MRLRAFLTAAAAGAILALGAGGASADTPSKVTIVGPADVLESGLFGSLIEPQFEAAFPQYELTYDPSAQGTAASSAEHGTGGPSVLVLHFAQKGGLWQTRRGLAKDFWTDGPEIGSGGDSA
jgi:hypothetical protein